MKLLAKDTAIYGLSSIIGRFLNYLLVPLYTAKMAVQDGGYGVITNMYALTAFILVLLTFGMETTFFRFSTKEGENPGRVFSTALTGVTTVSTLFFLFVIAFLSPISSFLGYEATPQFVWVMALTVTLDAIRAVPFASLRQQKKALKFAALQLLNIAINILLNVIYYIGMDGHDPGYAFYINLVCSAVITLCLYREIAGIRHGFDPQLMRRMLVYSWPIALLGVAGVLNQVADKILFPFLYTGSDMQQQLGIYGASVKIAMIMAMITQAFRYAYEPFVFNSSKGESLSDKSSELRDSTSEDKSKVSQPSTLNPQPSTLNSQRVQALAMKYFVIFTLLAFLCVTGWMGVLQYIIPEGYRVGLKVVPIVMAAEIMMGVYFNLSFWYKLSDKTYWGAVFSGIGCAVLISVNAFFVPHFGYMACAWGGFAGYGVAMTLSFIVGQRLHPIAYPVRRILAYVLLAIVAWIVMCCLTSGLGLWASLVCNTLIIMAFAGVVAKKELKVF